MKALKIIKNKNYSIDTYSFRNRLKKKVKNYYQNMELIGYNSQQNKKLEAPV